MSHIVIIGNGISGVTAARHIRKRSMHRISIVSSETDHFFSRTALMYIYMGHMTYAHTKPYEDRFWKKNKLELVRQHVSRVDTTARTVHFETGGSLTYDILIIASGSRSNKFGWPGQDAPGVQGLYGYPDLRLMEENTRGIQRAVLVGGGLIGVEMAEMLRSRNIDVTFLVREKAFWSNVLPVQEATLVSHHIRAHHVDLRLETELKEIRTGANGRVSSVVTTTGEIIECQFVGLAVGVSPNVGFLKGSPVAVRHGVLVNEYLETNIPNVYAIGDCVERTYALPGRAPIEQVWYTGRMMGEVVAQTICNERTAYAPGPWFNSAKFFDIEYQTYGYVGNVRTENEGEFFWAHDDGTRCMHFIWNRHTEEFTGVNTFGIRLRHACFDRWLREKQSIRYVINHLAEANFDPEFARRHEPAIVAAFNTAFAERNAPAAVR